MKELKRCHMFVVGLSGIQPKRSWVRSQVSPKELFKWGQVGSFLLYQLDTSLSWMGLINFIKLFIAYLKSSVLSINTTSDILPEKNSGAMVRTQSSWVWRQVCQPLCHATPTPLCWFLCDNGCKDTSEKKSMV